MLVGCANTPLAPGPRSSRRTTLSCRTSDQRPTTTRRTSSPPDCSITERETESTPDLVSRVVTSSHERSASPAQTSLTGKRLPSRPVANGSGKEPTTAGIRCAASHVWWSHHTRSPALRRRSAAPMGASMPLT